MVTKNNSQKMFRKIWGLLAWLVALVLLLSGCGGFTKTKTYTIGVINLVPVLDDAFTGFKDGMTELGYIEGENITYIYPGATSFPELDKSAQDLVDAQVDLIFTITTPATQAAQRATANNNIPVVFGVLTDPVGAGVVNSLTQPGGNITGVTFGPQEMQRFTWLPKIAPDVKRVYIMYNPDDSSAAVAFQTATETADTLGLEIVSREVRTAEELDAALAAGVPEDIDAIYTLPDSLTSTKLGEVLAIANTHHLPSSVANVDSVADGALYSYANKLKPTGAQAARLADQILKGIKPADLPVETTEFFLAINLKTAETIGLTIPDSILSQADTIFR